LEGRGQEQSDGGSWADTGKNTDQGPHGHADQAIEKILRLQRDAKAVGKTG
jgi:hypothetical protein